MTSTYGRIMRARKIVLLTSASWALATAAQAQTGQGAVPGKSGDSSGIAVEEVVVTGTQIRGITPVGSQVIAVDQAAIQDTGLQTTDDVIRSLPQISNLGSNALVTNSAAQNATLNVTRANGINLRGIGPQATLVLVDGHRPAPEGVGAQLFDPSAIPTLAVGRIEVVADGASGVYGADAVAGVVNVVLRKNFEGFETSLTASTANGYSGKEAAAILGKSWSGGSFMMSGDYEFNTTLAASARSGLYDSNLTSVGGTNQNVYGALPGNLCLSACGTSTTRAATEYGIPSGTGVGLTAAQLSSTLNTRNAFTNLSILPRSDKLSFAGSFQQKLLPDLDFRAETFFTDRHYYELTGDQVSSVTVPSSNPYYVAIPGAPACAASVGAPAGATCESVAYDFTKELGPAQRYGHEINYLIDSGLDYALPGDFKLSGDYVFAHDTEYDETLTDFAPAIASAALITNPATALNVFGSGASNNPATLAGLQGGFGYRLFTYDSQFVSLKLDGKIFSLPGGDVRLAVGAEEHADQLAGQQISNSNSTTVSAITVTSGPSKDRRTVTSGYAEVFIPIIGDGNALSFVQKLTADVAFRHDDYSDFGPTDNPKFGIQYQPIDGLVINGSYGTSFRAPTLSQKDPSSTATAFYNNANYSSCGCNSINIVGGNANIKPETATTLSLGADYKPAWLSGFHANLDFYHIDYKNIIDNPGSLNALVLSNPLYAFLLRRVSPTTNAADLAYVQSILSTPYYYNAAALPATSYNLIINGQQVNVGESRTSGIDFAVDYAFDIDTNHFTAGFSGDYKMQYDYSLVPGSPFVSDLNLINFPLQFKGRGSLGWSDDLGFRVNAFVNYVNGYTDNVAPLTGISGLSTTYVDSYTTVDLSIAYSTGAIEGFYGLANGIIISFNMQNAFDTAPPLALSGNYRYDSTVGNPMGRFMSLQLRKEF